MARSIACRCGTTLVGSDDEELVTLARGHVQQAHPRLGLTDDQLRTLIVAGARDAG